MANEPKVNLAFVETLPDNPVKGTVYMSPDSAEGFLKVGVGDNETETIFDSSVYAKKSDFVWAHGEGANSAVLKDTSSYATGAGAVAHGDNVQASGDYSHAEGINTIASGINSHAEGSNTRASGQASHAEGYQTDASGNYSHAEGYDTTAFGEYSHAEGRDTMAKGSGSHVEGTNSRNITILISYAVRNTKTYTYTKMSPRILKVGDILGYGNTATVTAVSSTSFTVDKTLNPYELWSNKNVIFDIIRGDTSYGVAIGNYSHAEGVTCTNNDYEHAEGVWNVSHKNSSPFDASCDGNTLFSIGAGIQAPSNAVEVMQNGDVYVRGIGNYDGSNYIDASTLQEVIDNGSGGVADLMTNVTYSELKALRDSSSLVPGMQYRITDYECTTTQTDTQSAGHVFDIIVTADSETKLNENARAAHHTGDTYFQNSDLQSWELKYSLDGDNTKFSWGPNRTTESFEANYDGPGIIGIRYPEGDRDGKYAWNTNSGLWYTETENLEVGFDDFYLYDENIDQWNTGLGAFVTAITEYGSLPSEYRGIIYYMKDEWGNIAPFDFKNMLFIRDSEWFGDHETWAGDVLGEVPETDLYFYFLSWVTEDGEVQEASIVGQTLTNDEGAYTGVYDNEIKETTVYDMATSTAFALPCTIIVSSYAYEDGVFYGCYGNKFGNNCYNNTFGNNFQFNTFGNDCGGNTFGNNFQFNTFGNDCGGNTFGNDCDRNSFGNDCGDNSFGNSCGGNTFGNNCYDNTFGNGCSGNTFGNNCYDNTFGNYCQTITVFDGVQKCSVTGGSSGSAPVKNAQILNGTAGASAQNKLTIAFAANKDYTQIAAKTTAGALKIYNPADLV